MKASKRDLAVMLASGGLMAAAATGIGAAPTFELAPKHVYAPTATDGCTGAPGGYGLADFHSACVKHDKCYSWRSGFSRLRCDKAFRENLGVACVDAYEGATNQHLLDDRLHCFYITEVYYSGVRHLGESYYNGAGDPT